MTRISPIPTDVSIDKATSSSEKEKAQKVINRFAYHSDVIYIGFFPYLASQRLCTSGPSWLRTSR